MKKLVLLLGGSAAAMVYACGDLTGTPGGILSIQFDTLGAPAVVVGDSLRDTTGAVVHAAVHAFNAKGEEIPAPTVRFQSPDSGVHVDSISGVITADSLRSTDARIFATVGSLQAVQRIAVTLSPDLITAVNTRDSIMYSLTDTTANVSPAVTVKLTHGLAPNDTAVRSWIVSFAIVSANDPNLIELVGDNGKPSTIDTTGTDGIAGRRIKLHPVSLTSATVVDSVILNATARYHGVVVPGSPVKLVVIYKPRS